MGEIWQARQEAPQQREAAVKVLRPGSPRTAQEQFRREVTILRRLRHKHIVRLLNSGEEGGLPYLAMRYVVGASLRDVIRGAWHWRLTSQRPTPTLNELARWAVDRSADPYAALCGAEEFECFAPPVDGDSRPRASGRQADVTERIEFSPGYARSAVAFMIAAADAVEYVHRAGVVHCDLKPSNIMVDSETGACCIIDFGVARWSSAAGAPGAGRADGGAAGVTGSLPYMAPEQFDGEADPRTDVWGLGATLYELLTLRRPFWGPTRYVVKDKVCNLSPARPRQLVRDFPDHLAAVCARALQKEPRRRYQTAQELADELRRWQTDWSARAAISGPRQWVGHKVGRLVAGGRRLVAGLAAGAAQVAAAGLGLLTRQTV
jgi:serine/threonine protein kinase